LDHRPVPLTPPAKSNLADIAEDAFQDFGRGRRFAAQLLLMNNSEVSRKIRGEDLAEEMLGFDLIND